MDLKIGLSTFGDHHKAIALDDQQLYDVLILGGGPAALTAAVYCMRKGVVAGILTRDIGGQVAETTGIENYMGYTHIEGAELVDKFKKQVEQFEVGLKEGVGADTLLPGRPHRVEADDGKTYRARSVIIATGKSPRRLGLRGEKKYTGKGVAYCAACDAPFFKDKKVVVVGGGNSGIEAALDLVKVAEEVTVIELMDHLNADEILVSKLRRFDNVVCLVNHEVTAISGNGTLNRITIKNRVSGKEKSLDAEGLFVEIGLVPNTGFLDEVVELNHFGEVVVDCACRTSVPGIFAAGDVTNVPFKQIVVATGEGAKAALSACNYIQTLDYSLAEATHSYETI